MDENKTARLPERVFTRAIRGYQPAEVDAYLDRVTENYAALYRENIELTRRLDETEHALAETKRALAEARCAAEEAKVSGEAVLREAYARADGILASVRESCDTILCEFRERIREQERRLDEARRAASAFKTGLYDIYRAQIELMERTVPCDAPAEITPADHSDEYVSRVVSALKRDIVSRYAADPTASADALHAAKEAIPLGTGESPPEQKKKKESIPSVTDILADGENATCTE